MRVALIGLSLLLAACQGSLVGDKLAGPQALAANDDAYCRSLGVAPGSQAYVDCRLEKERLRAAKHAVALKGISEGLKQMGTPPPRRTVNCTTMRNGAYLDTVCY